MNNNGNWLYSLVLCLVLTVPVAISGCTRGMPDPGASRSDQAANDLRHRINTTQVDR